MIRDELRSLLLGIVALAPFIVLALWSPIVAFATFLVVSFLLFCWLLGKFIHVVLTKDGS